MFSIENGLRKAQNVLLLQAFNVEKTGPPSLLLVGYVYKMFFNHGDIICLHDYNDFIN